MSESGFSLLPVRAEPTQRRVVHLVAIMLSELDIQSVLGETEKFDAVSAQRFGHLHAKFGRPAPPDVQHQQGDGNRSFAYLGDAPNSACTQFPNRYGYSPNVNAHHRGVGLAHPSSESLLHILGIAVVDVELKVGHGNSLKNPTLAFQP